jgi:hypothetical protein
VTAPKVADGGANAALIALEQRFVEVYFLPFFFAGALTGGFFATVVVEALAMLSDSERLSSTSTVCVIASVPLVSGPDGALAGAIVWVVDCDAPGPPLWREHAAGKSATSISRITVFISRNPNAEAMQFP